MNFKNNSVNDHVQHNEMTVIANNEVCKKMIMQRFDSNLTVLEAKSVYK